MIHTDIRQVSNLALTPWPEIGANFQPHFSQHYTFSIYSLHTCMFSTFNLFHENNEMKTMFVEG